LEVSGQLKATAPGKEPPVPIGYEAEWAPEPVLDDVERRKIFPLPGLEVRSLGRPARSQSLYRLRYPGSYIRTYIYIYKIDPATEVLYVGGRIILK
jgi:hypothetical protein